MLRRAVLRSRTSYPAISKPRHLYSAALDACVSCNFAVPNVRQLWRCSIGNAGQPPASKQRCMSSVRESSFVERNASLIAADDIHKIAAVLDSCPGCGALAQIVEPGQAGYYSNTRRAVRDYLKSSATSENTQNSAEQDLFGPKESSVDLDGSQTPLCDRCHDLVHHNSGTPIAHPSVDSIRETIEQSPYRYNHIYYLLDAADFPMSLIPHVHRKLGAQFQAPVNRRASSGGFRHGKKIEITFVITRADLLAPRKAQIDKLMQYFTSVLREALAPSFRNAFRLGNIRCVSAKRGWWTPALKADIWRRGGANWMVGKVNVGKSNLFEVIFPKGSATDPDEIGSQELLPEARSSASLLLPPARQETPYPIMPTVSSLPGTTASPIRIPFDNGRGEVIDLPGLARSDLDTHVQEKFREDLIMKSRITAKQQTIKPGQSLLLGGLIRITPLDPNLIVLAYPFVNIKPHLTSTEKALTLEAQGKSESSGIPLIVQDGVGATMTSAGKFQLTWDVTKQRTGPLTSKSAANLKPTQLPFQVMAADILIESLGWVEVVAQVRKRRGENEPIQVPEIEVFSPHGRYVSVRQPLNAWVMGGLTTRPSTKDRKQRPRKAMSTKQREPQTE